MIRLLILPDLINKKRSFLLRHTSLINYFCFVSILIISSFFLTHSGNVLSYATNINTSDLLEYTNKTRAEFKLKPLKINPKLNVAAENKAKDMFEKGYWAHISPTGKEPWDFIKASGYEYLYAGENLAVDFANSQNVVKAWYNSPSHRENLLGEEYTEIGFAVVNGELKGRKTTLVVQMFGYPKNIEVASTIGESEDIVVENFQEPVTVEAVQPSEELANVELIEVSSVSEPVINVPLGKVLSSSDVFSASRYISLILGLFLSGLLAIDGYYTRVKGIFRLSGHTFLHLFFFVLAIIGIWYSNVGLIL